MHQPGGGVKTKDDFRPNLRLDKPAKSTSSVCAVQANDRRIVNVRPYWFAYSESGPHIGIGETNLPTNWLGTLDQARTVNEVRDLVGGGKIEVRHARGERLDLSRRVLRALHLQRESVKVERCRNDCSPGGLTTLCKKSYITGSASFRDF